MIPILYLFIYLFFKWVGLVIHHNLSGLRHEYTSQVETLNLTRIDSLMDPRYLPYPS